jgi:hypothetical protein
VCVCDHLQLQALAGHPEGLLRDVTDGPYGVIVLRLQQLVTAVQKTASTTVYERHWDT